MIIVTTSFSKSSVIKMISVHTKNENGLKGVLETLRFRDGLVWTVGVSVEINCCVFKFLRRSLDAAEA